MLGLTRINFCQVYIYTSAKILKIWMNFRKIEEISYGTEMLELMKFVSLFTRLLNYCRIIECVL